MSLEIVFIPQHLPLISLIFLENIKVVQKMQHPF